MAVLGWTNIGSSFTNGNGNDRADGNVRTASSSGTTVDFNWYTQVPSGTANAYGALFVQNGSNWDKVGQVSFGTVNTTPALYTQPFVFNITSGLVYHIIGWMDQNYDDFLEFNAGQGDAISIFLGAIGGTFPASYANAGVSTSADTQMTIYINYNIAVAATPQIIQLGSIRSLQSIKW